LGEEYELTHNAFQEDIAHKAIDFGADLIVGHHPHVVQDIEEYKGRLVAYSLGNFVFDQNFDEKTKEGIILKAVFRGKNLEQHYLIPIAFTKEYQPFISQ
jgi:poly-gamma-glutamate synthesis protein (capsule biosynthesis protein)